MPNPKHDTDSSDSLSTVEIVMFVAVLTAIVIPMLMILAAL